MCLISVKILTGWEMRYRGKVSVTSLRNAVFYCNKEFLYLVVVEDIEHMNAVEQYLKVSCYKL